jgi:hypothetical protein
LTKEKEFNPYIEIVDLTEKIKIEEKINSNVPLYPAGRIYQMHCVEERIHFSHENQLYYSHMIFTPNCHNDHTMNGYLNSLKNFIDYSDD